MIYGYVRVSTLQQNIERQITDIKARYPDAIIIRDEFTGKTMDRPGWKALYPKLQKGDVLVFDEVSRMSRDAVEGFKTYQDLYHKGVDLIFLQEPHINTESYRQAMKGSINVDISSGDRATDDLVNAIMEALNRFMMEKVQDDIRRAFEKSQSENESRSRRQKGGIKERQKHNKELEILYGEDAVNHEEYRQIGRASGDKLNVKKAGPIQDLIRKYSRDFDGSNSDPEVMAILEKQTVKVPVRKRSGATEYREVSAKLSRNTYYKYKNQMRGEADER